MISAPHQKHRAELHVEIDDRTELFLFAVEASFSPAHHFYGSDIPNKIYEVTIQLPTIEEAMIFLGPKTPGEYHDVVEICGGSARVSKILISRRRYDIAPNFDLVAGVYLLE